MDVVRRNLETNAISKYVTPTKKVRGWINKKSGDNAVVTFIAELIQGLEGNSNTTNSIKWFKAFQTDAYNA